MSETRWYLTPSAVGRIRQAVERALTEARPHTMASENADVYSAYYRGAESVADAFIQALDRETGNNP